MIEAIKVKNEKHTSKISSPFFILPSIAAGPAGFTSITKI